MQARPYQLKAIQSIYDYFAAASGNPVLELPTGSGKSFVQAEFLRGVLTRWPAQRILCLAHVKELIAQNHAELMGIWPDAPAGIHSAGLGRRDVEQNIIFASIQSVFARAAVLGRIDLVIIDEAQMVSPRSSTMYRTLISALTVLSPNLKVVGMSATPWRLNGGPLTAGDDALFTDLISAKKLGATLPDLVRQDHLAPVITPGEKLPQLSTEGVKKSGGDFRIGALSHAVARQLSTTKAACQSMKNLGADRKCWIVFGVSVAHVEEIRACLVGLGIAAAVVTGQTPKDLRDERIEKLRSGALRALVSVNVLSVGFNVRQVDMIGALRPTASSALYLQMMGRGMRTYPGKSNCLVLDFAGLIAAHGPVDGVKAPRLRKTKNGEAIQKECPACVMLIAIGAMTCPFCGHEFPQREIQVEAKASTLAIMGKRSLVPHQPTAATYSVHSKPGKPDSVRVTYWRRAKPVGFRWICVGHDGWPRMEARRWWDEYVCGPMPYSAAVAVEVCRSSAVLPSLIEVDDSKSTPLVIKSKLIWKVM